MIIDNTNRIPKGQKDNGRTWALEQGNIESEKQIGGFIVLKIEQYIKNQNDNTN